MSGRRLTRVHFVSATLATAILAGGTYLGLAQPEPVSRTATRPPLILTPEPTRPPEPATRGQRLSSPDLPSPTPSRASTVTSSGSCGASFYDEPQGTASGETFNPEELTAAHKTLPFNTLVRVTNPASGKSVTVRINDRGPYIDGRCLDLSRAAFREIADLGQGILDVVRYEVLAR